MFVFDLSEKDIDVMNKSQQKLDDIATKLSENTQISCDVRMPDINDALLSEIKTSLSEHLIGRINRVVTANESGVTDE